MAVDWSPRWTAAMAIPASEVTTCISDWVDPTHDIAQDRVGLARFGWEGTA